MRSAVPILLTLAFVTSPDAGACAGKSFAPIVELRISQPVLASPDGDSTYLVAIDASGCVKLHFPAYDTRAGTYAYRLGTVELDQLRRELAASAIIAFQPEAVKSDLSRRNREKQASGSRDGYLVRDEEILEFIVSDVAIGGKGDTRRQFVWTGLREQLLNHPDHAALIGLAAVRDRLNQFSIDVRMKRVQQ